MKTQTTPTTGLASLRIIALALVIAATAWAMLPSALLAAESTPMPENAASAAPTLAPAEAACESADDVRLIVEFLQETDVEEDGWLPFMVGAIAGLSETRQLVGLVGETYRPLVEDLVISFEGLGASVDELRDLETAGAQVASIGEAVTEIGYAMDALSVQLRTPCPTDD